MTNHGIWGIAIDRATVEFQELDPSVLFRVNGIVRELLAVKTEIASLFDGLNGVEICRLCRGECCQTGCFHFTAVDLLAYLATGRELFTPRFDNGACPYLGETGCLIEPPYRPYNCVTFLCDRIDAGMDPALQSRFAALSSTLLSHYRSIEELFANRFVSGILNNGTRFLEGRSQGILWSRHGDN